MRHRREASYAHPVLNILWLVLTMWLLLQVALVAFAVRWAKAREIDVHHGRARDDVRRRHDGLGLETQAE